MQLNSRKKRLWCMKMEFGYATGSGDSSGDERDASDYRTRAYYRHTPEQIQFLEAYFKDCTHPNESQRLQLSRELRLSSPQIRFWFQNKRTQMKTQSQRTDNTILHAENERMQFENNAMREALKNLNCPSCRRTSLSEERLKLLWENLILKEEHERRSVILAKYVGKPVSEIKLDDLPVCGSSSDSSTIGLPAMQGEENSFFILSPSTSNSNDLKEFSYIEKKVMADAATIALDELARLLHMNEPLWIKSTTDESYHLRREYYEKIFPVAAHFKRSTTRVDASKEITVVPMEGTALVDMLLDADKWAAAFPSIITKAKTIKVLDAGNTESRSGSLQLMYGELHTISPLVPAREIFFLRHCLELEQGLWVIVDVSYDCPIEMQQFFSANSLAWRLPSGCMIQSLADGNSKITWVEHMQVDDKGQTHKLFRDVVCSNIAYGAGRWLATLRRTCERMLRTEGTVPQLDHGGVICSAEGRKNIIYLADRMMKEFFINLKMSDKLDFPQLSDINGSGVRISIRIATDPGTPNGTIVAASTSLWIPLSPDALFTFFTDPDERAKWDVLANWHPMDEIGHISTGCHLWNCISLLRPFAQNEPPWAILQETVKDEWGAMMIYAPVELAVLNIAIGGGCSDFVAILPSGITISGDGHPKAGPGSGSDSGLGSVGMSGTTKENGSLLTLAQQILVSPSTTTNNLNVESVAMVDGLITSTVERIRGALYSSGLV